MRFIGRWIVWIVGFVAALAVVVVPAWVAGGDAVLPRLASFALSAAGVEGVDRLAFRLAVLDRHRLVLDDLVIGADRAATVGRVEVGWSPFEGRVHSLTLSDARLRGLLRDDGLSFGSLDPLLEDLAAAGANDTGAADPGGAAATLPALRITRGRIDLATAWGDATLTLDAHAEPAGPAPMADARFGLTLVAGPGHRLGAGAFRSRGRAMVVREGRDAWSARATLDSGLADFDRFAVGGVRAVLQLDAVGDRPRRAALEATLAVIDADGMPVGPVRAAAFLDEESVGASLAMGTDGQGASLTIASPDPLADTVTASVSASAEMDVLARLLAPLLGTEPAPGTGRVSLSGTLRAPPADVVAALADPGAVAAMIDGTGRLTAEGVGLEGVDVDGVADVALESGRLSVVTVAPTRVRVSRALAVHMTPLANGPVTVTFGTGERAFAAAAALGAGRRIDLSGPATVVAEGGPSLAVDGAVTVMPAAADWRADLRQVELTARRLGAPPVGTVRLRLDGTAGASALDVRYDATVGLAHGDAGATSLRGALEMSGRAITGDGALVLEHTSGRLRLRDATVAGRRLAEPATFPVRPDGGRSWLRLGWPGPSRVDGALVIGGGMLALTGSEGTTDRIALGALRAGGRFDLATRDGTVELSLADSAYAGDGLPLAVDGVAATAGIAIAAGTPRLASADLTVARLADTLSPARLTPLSIALTARGGDDALDLEAAVTGIDGAPRLEARGTVDAARRSLAGSFRLAPLTLVPGEAGVAALSPWLARWVKNVEGTLSATGTLSSGPDLSGLDGTLAVVLDGLSVETRYGHLAGLNGTVSMARLLPPVTAGPQTVTAEALLEPVPIQAPRLVIEVEEDGLIVIESIDGHFADGRLRAADIRFRPGEPLRTDLEVDRLGAENLARLVDLDGLAATGTLSGRLPVVVDPTRGVSIRRGVLAADGPGVVRYAPDAPPAGLAESGEQVDLMLKAVRNFQYESLSMAVNGEPGQNYEIRLALSGANPDLYDGYPLKFNLKLSGRLDDIIQTALRTYGLPGRIDELLRDRQDRR